MASDSSTVPLRLFVAISIPEPVRNEMLRVQRELQPLAPQDAVRWTKPDQLHLTLCFLGDLPVDSVDALKTSLAEACTGVGPLRLHAQGIGFFPNTRSPRVLWVGIHDQEGVLAGLQKRIETAVRSFTAGSGTEKFLAHATLGRFQKYRRHKTEKLLSRALLFDSHVFGDWQTEGVGLFRSELSPAGAHHTLLATFQLS